MAMAPAPARGRACAGRARRRLCARVAQAAAAVALGAAALCSSRGSAPSAPSSAWVSPSLPSLHGQWSPASPARGPAALNAVQTRKKGGATSPTKKGKYRGAVNPRLRSFMGSSEYREMVQLLSRLNEEKVLDDFLDKAEKYWGSINVFKLAELERSEGGRGVMATVKGDWPRIWPEALEAERLGAFEQFQRFWGRLERSKLVDDVMKEVLPDMDKGYDDSKASSDWKKLKDMTDEERSNEVLGRIGKCELVKQYIILSESDPEVRSVGSKMMPFMARSISLLERKVAAETEELAQSLDQTFLVGGAALVLLIAGFATGVIPSPLKILGDIWNFTI